MGLFSKNPSIKKAAAVLKNQLEKDSTENEVKTTKSTKNSPMQTDFTNEINSYSSRATLKPAEAKKPNPHSTHENPQRQINTVVDDSTFEDFEKDDYSDGDSPSALYSSDAYSSGQDDDYEEHTHAFIERDFLHSVSHISALMGYCGLGQSTNKEALKNVANEVSKRTFSLLTNGLQIHRLSPTMRWSDPRFHESVVGKTQFELVKSLKSSILNFLDVSKSGKSPYDFLQNNKTLLDRYGSVKDIIGRGAYGLIRVVYQDETTSHFKCQKVYAVKELKRRYSGNKASETREQFVDRVLSEFIISSTLNNKHVVRTLDLMITLPAQDRVTSSDFCNEVKISQVMKRTNGGDLFHYCKRSITTHEYLSIDEVDCMVKQITKGLWYIHSHGVAHCDLKLENILLESDPNCIQTIAGKKRCRLNLKISDFGKANVVRTQWDSQEQLSLSNVAIGSEPYMAPEEHTPSDSGISLLKKDCWALGVLILILFNIRRSYFYKGNGGQCFLEFYNSEIGECDTKSYGAAYLWQTTEAKILKLGKYKDAVFGEYVKNAMVADYDRKTKEWSVRKLGKFIPIETMFDVPAHFTDPGYHGDAGDFYKDDFDLRKFCTYKLLDMNPKKRLDSGALLKSDWLASVECCGD